MGFGATWSDSDTGQSAASGFRAITEHARTIAGTANRRLYGLGDGLAAARYCDGIARARRPARDSSGTE